MHTLANQSKAKATRHARRKHRANTKAKLLSDLPRIIVNKSNKHIRAQIVDTDGTVLATASDLAGVKGTKSESAHAVGEALAKAATANKITDVVFDRNGHLFHGRVAQLAE